MLILSKIHKAEFIEDMYEKEYLRFSSLKDFRSDSKDLTGRLDSRELNVKNVQLKTLTISTDKNELVLHEAFNEFNAQYMEHLSNPKTNCCSLHWMEIEPEQPPTTFNYKLLSMGDKALLIYDWIKFFEILDSSIEELKLKYSRKKVEYYNPKSFNGDITLHHKNEQYSWQNEYRILISPTDDQPINISIKGLKKISYVIDSKNYENIRIKLGDQSNQ